MIVSYLRSSSIGTFDSCEHKYFLSYVLGLPEKANKKADKGSAVHKALEILALVKNGPIEDEIGCFDSSTDLRTITLAAFNRYKKPTWTKSDEKDIYDWTVKALTLDGGIYHPNNMNILEVEKRFDIELEHDWAKYEYEFNGKKYTGQLSLKGTIDVIVDHGDYIEIVDWKTGQRKNWATGERKCFDKLKKDNQLLLYYYVARRLYQKHVVVTIVYINDGGSFTLDLSDDEYVIAEKMIQEKFEAIKNSHKPKAIYPHDFCGFCEYSKKYFDKPKKFGNGKDMPICAHIRDEVYQIGMVKTVDKYVQNNGAHLTKYSDGGGRKAEWKSE